MHTHNGDVWNTMCHKVGNAQPQQWHLNKHHKTGLWLCEPDKVAETMGTMISAALQPLRRLRLLTKPSNKVCAYLTWPSLSPFSSPSACSGWSLPDCDAAVPSSWTAQRLSPPQGPAPATSQLSLHLFIHQPAVFTPVHSPASCLYTCSFTSQLSLHLFIHQPAVFTPVHSPASCLYRHSLTPPAVFTGLHSHLCITSQLSLQECIHTCTSPASCLYRHSFTPPAVFTGIHSHPQLSLQAFIHTSVLPASCLYRYSFTPVHHQPAVFTGIHSHLCIISTAVFTGIHSHLYITSQLSLQACIHTSVSPASCLYRHSFTPLHHQPAVFTGIRSHLFITNQQLRKLTPLPMVM